MKKIINEALSLLEKDEDFVIASVITQSGSSPRGAGAEMIVRKNGVTYGTVGGGMVEGEVERLAAEVFNNKKALIKEFSLSGSETAEMDMICGGTVVVYLHLINADNQKYLKTYKAYQDLIEKEQKGWFFTLISEELDSEICSQFLLVQDRNIIGGSIPDLKVSELLDICTQKNDIDFFTTADKQRYMLEKVGKISRAYVFGAGHIGQKLTPLLSYAGFYTTVLDDRAKFANKERLPDADDIIILDSFEDSVNKLGIDEDSYIIIVTRGHQFDQSVLTQALDTKAAYIGMLGSRAKKKRIFNNLIDAGYSKSELQKVNAPIGIKVNAETPEEIGFSITAKLIKTRAEKRFKTEKV